MKKIFHLAFLAIIIVFAVGSCQKREDPIETVNSIQEISAKIAYIEKTLNKRLTDEQFKELSNMLVSIYDKLGNYEKMSRMVDLIIQKNNGDCSTLNNIAFSLAEANLYLDKALKASETAIKWTRESRNVKGPDDISNAAWQQRIDWRLSAYLDTYGNVLYTLGLMGRADASFNEAINLDAENVDALMHSAIVKIALERYADAFDQAAKAYILQENNAIGLAEEAYKKWKDSGEDFDQDFDQRVEELKREEKQTLINTQLNIEAPDFQLKDTGGNNIRLSDYKGSIVFLDFWATWCSPCLKELPLFQAMHDEYSGKDIVFLAISTDKEKDKVIPFLEENKYTFKVLYDNGMKKAYNVAGIPTVFIINQDGIIKYKNVGFRADITEIWTEQLQQLMSNQ